MAKRNRPKISTSGKTNVEDALNIADNIVNEPKEKKQKKKEPSVRFNIRIPKNLHNRLEDAAETTGLSKSGIIIKGLFSELNKLDKE